MSRAYEIFAEEEKIVVRFDSSLVDRDSLVRLLDHLDLESLRKRSRLTEEQASGLADEVDASVWEQVRHKYSEG